MKTLTVDLGQRSYPIFIGSGLIRQSDCYAPYINGQSVVIVSNETIAPLYLDQLMTVLGDYTVSVVLLKDGEAHKHLQTVDSIFTAMLEHRCDRNTTVLALGGGVVGDIAGFASACYQRGVNFIQIPTTLLSQVDSSVGGKTGVNHPMGKNMIGAFYQPQSVVIDIDTLSTLDERQFAAGMAEVIKYGLLWDRDYLAWLDDNMPSLLKRDSELLTETIYRSCHIKADVVSQDERESNVRALLNLGHTFGHAIETTMGYGEWLHGEAVAVGMVMAAEMSAALGMLDQDDVVYTKDLLTRAGLPTKAPKKMQASDFIDKMSVDKKVQNGVLRLVLLTALGTSTLTSDFSAEQLELVIQQHLR